MILFPNAKINIGLDVLRKRNDGFHDLETIFYPTQLCDILEINQSDDFLYSQTGIEIEGDVENNLVVKAFRLLKNEFDFPNVNIHLHKQIPFGAGLGGGSSDAAFTLKGINELFNLEISEDQLLNYAGQLGSDCPFFILNRPVFAEGRGEQFKPVDLSLEGWTMVLIKPECSVSTAEAYGNIKPMVPNEKLLELIKSPVMSWKDKVKNQFEESVFPLYPEIEDIKKRLYNKGAIYSCMSGSGSAVFGMFNSEIADIENEFQNCFIHKEKIVR